jgi:hypothetical protein
MSCVVICIVLDVDVHEARVVPHIVVVSIYLPCPPLYTPGVGVLVGYKIGVLVGL